jgi:hypothetical protein
MVLVAGLLPALPADACEAAATPHGAAVLVQARSIHHHLQHAGRQYHACLLLISITGREAFEVQSQVKASASLMVATKLAAKTLCPPKCHVHHITVLILIGLCVHVVLQTVLHDDPLFPRKGLLQAELSKQQTAVSMYAVNGLICGLNTLANNILPSCMNLAVCSAPAPLHVHPSLALPGFFHFPTTAGGKSCRILQWCLRQHCQPLYHLLAACEADVQSSSASCEECCMHDAVQCAATTLSLHATGSTTPPSFLLCILRRCLTVCCPPCPLHVHFMTPA